METNTLVGIDLGTSYSSIASLDRELFAHPIPDQRGRTLIDSAVFIQSDGGGVLVGREAVTAGLKQPERVIAASKRYLGEARVWEIDGIEYTPVDVAAFILRHLLSMAKPVIGAVKQAVISVPAHFTAHQRQLTIDAGKQAGLQRVDIVNEPVAAALSFVLGEEGGRYMMYLQVTQRTVLIYDLGGGTFDLSIVRYAQGELRVLATSGERRLGGLDWDDVLVKTICRDFRESCRVDVTTNKKVMRELGFKVEHAKRELSERQFAEVVQHCGEHGLKYRFELEEFERATEHLVERTRVLTEQLLTTAGMTWGDIDTVVPVGGPTQMPMIQRLLHSFEQEGPQVRRIPPQTAVVNGAASFAGILYAGQDGPRVTGSILANYKLKNVNANDLSVLVLNGSREYLPHVMIPKNTPLPASAAVHLATSYPNQRRISVKIVEGNARTVSADRLVCKCTIDGLPANLPTGSQVDVNLNYTADGLIYVVVAHADSGRLATVSSLYEPLAETKKPQDANGDVAADLGFDTEDAAG